MLMLAHYTKERGYARIDYLWWARNGWEKKSNHDHFRYFNLSTKQIMILTNPF